MSSYLENARRPKNLDVKDTMILKGIALGKTLREMRDDILAKSHNTVEDRIRRLTEKGYVREHGFYDRGWQLTDLGREELRKSIS